ncbi:MAG: hypothetical protein A2V98_07005 [Planctomycetes bacterium RBG_16_64_12]|nr:MAG: hypothetical protein A2V98_07005 [Planctomycetes bacterium RBG_16_64_12]
MTLVELESMALANNPTLVQAAMRVRAARDKCLQVGLYPNPVVGYSGAEIGNDGSAGQQGAFLSQQVVTAGKLQLNRAVVWQEVEQAQHAWEAQRRRVLNDVGAGYYDVLLAQRTVQLQEKLVGIGDASLRTSEQLLAAQEVSQVEVLQARIEADSVRLQLAGARNQLRAAWRRLAAILGVADLEAVTLAGDLEDDIPHLNWEDALEHLLATSPEVGQARAGVERARRRLERECAGRVPDLEVEASVHYDFATDDKLTGFQFGVPLPLYNRNQGNIRQAQAELVAARKEVERLELSLRRRLAGAFERYATAREQVQSYSGDILPHAQKQLTLVTTGFRQGELDYLTTLTAQRSYFRANLAYLESLGELWGSVVAIEGLLLSDALETAP